MAKIIKQVDDKVFKKDPITNEDVEVPLKVKIKLENRLDPEADAELQADGFQEYTKTFEREIGFSNGGEQTLIMSIITKITDYDQANQKYVIFEGWNNTLYIKNVQTQEETIYRLNPNVMVHVRDLVKWLYTQEKMMSYTEN